MNKADAELQKWKDRFPNARISVNSYGSAIYCDDKARENLPTPCRRALSENRWKELGFEVIPEFRETLAIGFSTYKGLSAIYPNTAVKAKLSVFAKEKIEREIRQMQTQINSPHQPATARSQSDELADKWEAMRAAKEVHLDQAKVNEAFLEMGVKTGRFLASAPAPKVTLSEQEALDYLLGKPTEVFGPVWTLTECEPPNAFGRSMYAEKRNG